MFNTLCSLKVFDKFSQGLSLNTQSTGIAHNSLQMCPHYRKHFSAQEHPSGKFEIRFESLT